MFRVIPTQFPRLEGVCWFNANLSSDWRIESSAASLAGYKMPRSLVLVDEVGRSPAGKADYRWAKEQALQD